MEILDLWLPCFLPLLHISKWIAQRLLLSYTRIKTRGPLSPFLFSLVADAFAQVLPIGEEQNLIKGV